MEELSIEEKAKRYDEAIKIARALNSGKHIDMPSGTTVCECIFPELKKKTDEEMIQKLIAVCHLYYGEGEDAERDECLEWLEKQNNKNINDKKINSELFEQMFTIPDGCVATIEGNRIHIKREGKSATEAIKEEKIDNANKIEPKFKVGDWVVKCNGQNFCNDSKFAQITEIGKDGRYWFDCETWLEAKDIRLWTIKDAKDGDILTSSDSRAFIYNGCYNSTWIGAYCGLDINDEFVIADKLCDWTSNYNIRPATEKQRIALFDEMNYLNYAWNTETKELNRLNKNNENNN